MLEGLRCTFNAFPLQHEDIMETHPPLGNLPHAVHVFGSPCAQHARWPNVERNGRSHNETKRILQFHVAYAAVIGGSNDLQRQGLS